MSLDHVISYTLIVLCLRADQPTETRRSSGVRARFVPSEALILQQEYCQRIVCVMVSPNRQGHIVATPRERSGYGRYRNMTPRGHPTSALGSPATNQHRKADSATEDRRESERGSGA